MMQELKDVIRPLANGKAVGSDAIPVELFKVALSSVSALRQRCFDIVVGIWMGGQVRWKDAVITMLHKMRDRTECSNYRGISLVADTDKMLPNVVACRLSHYCERVGILSEEKNDIRPNHRTICHVMFKIRRPQELAREEQIPLYACLIDLTKAYDFVDLTLMWKVDDFGHPSI